MVKNQTLIVRYTVLDEADEMLQGDWEEKLKHVLSHSGLSCLAIWQFLSLSLY